MPLPNRVTVSVPGSSANLGPGFDCLGVALPLRLTVTAVRRPGPLAVRLSGEGASELPADASNLVVATMLVWCRVADLGRCADCVEREAPAAVVHTMAPEPDGLSVVTA